MMPICYRCKKADISVGSVLSIKCTIDPTRKLFTAPLECKDYERTDDGAINYPKEKE